jgi:hypothetical protein
MAFDMSAIQDENAKNKMARIDAVAVAMIDRLLAEYCPSSFEVMRVTGEDTGDKAYEFAYGFEAARKAFYKDKGL